MSAVISGFHRATVAAIAVAALSGLALADDVRGCTAAELAAPALAPMPKDVSSMNDFGTDRVRVAGYLLTIDGGGRPTVLCAIDEFTDSAIRERGAAVVSKFVYWPADATPAGALVYVHLQSQGYGVTMPSVLPRESDPTCDQLESQYTGLGVEPIFAPELVYQRQNLREGITGHAMMLVLVKDSGAAYLVCRAAGQNIERLEEAIYYNAARFRFPAEAGRPPFYYRIEYKFQMY